MRERGRERGGKEGGRERREKVSRQPLNDRTSQSTSQG